MKYLCIAFTLMISTSVFSQIQQNVNKTTGPASNPISDIDSIRFNGSQTEMEIILNNGNIESHTISDINNVTFSGQLVGEVTSLDCAGANINGALIEGVAASGVSAVVAYTGGNGGPHNGQTVNSTGITGLTATLAAGNFANGAGTLTYTITGTPNTSGTASFAIEIGGISCVLEVIVHEICDVIITAVVEVTSANGKIWMDRNLGASQAATSSTDVNAYGDLYQWGRSSDDGHQCRTSPTTATLSSADQPGNGNFIITGLDVPYDWRSPQNDNLWQGVNGVNNPCPSGYRLPTETEWEAERTSWTSNDAAGAFASPLKLTLAGGRSEDIGLFAGVGTTGFYWSSTVNSPNSRNLNFNNGAALVNANVRAFGHSVRCIKDVAAFPTIDCGGATINGSLVDGIAASGVSANVGYTGGNGGPHNGQTVTSTGVTGLTATLAAGSFANGSGTLTYAITGTPSGSGTASFALNIGGANCVLTVTVSVNVGLISTLNCAVSQTFTNSTVTAIPDLNCLTSSISVSGYSGPINTNQIVVSFTTTHASMSNLRLFIQAPNGSLIGLANLNNPNGGGGGTGCAAAPATLTNVKFGDAGVDLTGCPANNTLYLPNYLQVTSGCNYTSTGYTGVSPTANGNTQTFAGTLGATYNPNGTWNLIVIDATATSTGSLTSWSIIFPDYSGGTINGSLVDGVAASGVSANVVYTGGNGGPHNGQTVISTGITGLTATLGAGNFANGNGNLTYTITGTPTCSGIASFALNIGGQSCALNLIVSGNPPPTFYCLGVPAPVIEVTSATGRIWMDRNLGASQVAISLTDVNAYGDLYQWGRGTDGHQCRNSATTPIQSCSDQPAHGDFILASNAPNDWRNPQNTNLWQGVNGINNPCPSGFRVPTQAEFNAERLSWTSQDAAGAFNSPLKLTYAGGRDAGNGVLYAFDINGFYWTSTLDAGFNNQPRYLGFFGGGSSLDLSSQGFGLPVRCIKD